MPTLTLLNRSRGCFLGLAIGDALGAPLEGLSPQQIRTQYHVVDDFVDGVRAWKKKPYRWRMPGLYTDDTQQALVLTDVLLANGSIVPEEVASIYLSLANPRDTHAGAHRGTGRSFRQVLLDLEKGISPRQTGQASAGIGAAMRIAPLGVYFHDQPDAIFDAVMAASLITHRDIRSLAGAMAVAYAVQRLVAGEPCGAGLLLWVAADVAKAEDRIAAEYPASVVSADLHRRSVSTSIAKAEALLELPRNAALAAIIEEANQHGSNPVCRNATMGFPPALIPACLYLLMTTESLEEAIVEVVNLGRDADSAGAILGALAGASYGAETIPERWLERLRNREGIDYRGQALAYKSAQGLPIPELVQTEHDLTLMENEVRERMRNNFLPNGGDLGANRRAGH